MVSGSHASSLRSQSARETRGSCGVAAQPGTQPCRSTRIKAWRRGSFAGRRRRGFGLLRAYRRGFNARPRDRLNNFLVNQWFKWWSQGESNPRPLECHSSALPTELWPRPSNGVPRRGRFDLDCDPQTFLMSYSGCQWPGLRSSADTARRATGCCGSTADLKSQIRDRLKSPHHPLGHRR